RAFPAVNGWAREKRRRPRSFCTPSFATMEGLCCLCSRGCRYYATREFFEHSDRTIDVVFTVAFGNCGTVQLLRQGRGRHGDTEFSPCPVTFPVFGANFSIAGRRAG